MDTSYLSKQVNNSIGQLHSLFDDIGVPDHEREAREAELFKALSEALNNHLRMVTSEKKEMIDEAKKIVTAIRQMEASLDDSKHRRKNSNGGDLKITYPLVQCLQTLKDKHSQVQRLHRERYDQVKKLVEALESYSSHLEPSFVKIALPPTGPNQSIPLTFDLSTSYVDRLDAEFTRVYEEYTRRLAKVETLGDQIIQLWAELGTPQAQQDTTIIKYYRDAPEQLGLHQDDIDHLQAMHDKLSEEKKNREKKLLHLKATVENLWEKLGIDEQETKAFLNQNRGCGIRQINEFEDELERLNEVKRQNMHIFIEDTRVRLQELWDALYFSEDEMLEFTPAFSDVYSDALLEAHEREVARLEALREERAPTLDLVDKHKGLIKDRDELIASSQDASRLMLRGQKGEKRDPGKLLREEKMRKRIAKELPKVTAELRKVLEQWEEEYDRPFLVYGERYLDEVEAEDAKKPATTSRSRTPAGPPPSAVKALQKSVSSSAMRPGTATKGSLPPRSMAKTPTAGIYNMSNKSQPMFSQSVMDTGRGSPTRQPSARAPLSRMKDGNNSPERPRAQIQKSMEMLRTGGSVRIPPPKMRDLRSVVSLETPLNPYKSMGLDTSVVRTVDPEDVYDDRPPSSRTGRPDSNMSHRRQPSYLDEENDDHYSSVREVPRHPQGAQSRLVSSTSTTSTVVTGSENWETYDDYSESEPDASEEYYAKLRAARGKRVEPEQGHRPTSSTAKRTRGVPAAYAPPVMIDQDGNRVVSGSEWTDEDGFP
ncbi:microtubule-associated, map65 ase1-type [Trichoderma arundinaceum]|uniref:Microtubule-associated, map65 ase1-type n=1 Tax=Trichoderma arundinaceum TaxID=490622 RepID=A0A395NU29_TRIAR|nr:microtubule-associated, map65 ase1-type [Trichoderma arundinaceum]